MSKRIRSGQSRVEIIANHEEILKLIEQGYTLLRIYEAFVENKKFTMSYPTFCAAMRKYFPSMASTRFTPMQEKKEEIVSSSPVKIIGQKQAAFGKSGRKNFEDMFGDD